MKNLDYQSSDNRKLLIWLSLAIIAISIISLFINRQINLSEPIINITYACIIIFAILAFVIKKGLSLKASQVLLVLASIVFTNLLWYFEHGHYGPILFIFIIIFALVIFMWDGIWLITSAIALLINIVACFIIEYNYPELIPDYDDTTSRIFDVYTGIIMFMILIYALMRAVKISYSHEYRKAMQSDKLKSSFLENINHEVRTPLNAIIGFSSLLNEDDITQDQRKEYNEMISESNDALLRIIDDILLVSTLESDDANTNNREYNLDEVIEGLHKSTSQLLIKNKKEHIKLYISEPNVSAIVETDKIRLQQVFIRLIDNAIKYTNEGKINFGYKVEQDKILFHVADTGIGIQGKHQSKIFERFYKVEIDKNNVFRGTGIGLYITKKIVESLNGDIWLSSIFGSGTTFYFSIPKSGYRVAER